jgi:hypothetical protein
MIKKGDLVKDIYCGDIYIITSNEYRGYHDVCDAQGNHWHVPKEHLEVIK